MAVAAALTLLVLIKGKHPEAPQRSQVAVAKPVVSSAAPAPLTAPAPTPVAAVPASAAPPAEPATPKAAVMPASSPISSPVRDADKDKDKSPTPAAVSASRRWVLGLPASSLVVVHAQKATLREADAFRSGQSLLANARILQTAGPHSQYLVVTGPFRSAERARNYIQRLHWKASARDMARDELLTLVPR